MVDPNVLRIVASTQIFWIAFGMGIDRIALLNYQIPDIRMLSENDIHF